MTPKPPRIADTPPPLPEELILKHIGQIAYNTPGFATWAVKFKDKSADIDPAELKTRFEAFQSIKETAKELKSAYAPEIEKEFGITMSDKDLDDVDVFLEVEAINNPEGIPKILEQVRAMRASETELTGAQEELKNLSKNSGYESGIATRDKKKEDILKVMENRGFLSMTTIRLNALFNDKSGMMKSFLELRKRVVEEIGGSSDADFLGALQKLSDENDELKQQLDLQTAGVEHKVELAKQKLKRFKTGIFAIDTLQNMLAAKITQKLTDHAEKLASVDAIKVDHKDALTKAHAGLEFTQKFIRDKKGSNELDINIDGIDEDALTTRIDEWAEKIARNRLNTAVEKVKLGNKDWDKMQAAFEGFMRLEKIGSKEGDEAREWLVEEMEITIETLRGDDGSGNPPVSRGADYEAKANILEIMLRKLLTA